MGLDESPYRGMIKFGDDDFDSRTVCTDVSIAEAVLKSFMKQAIWMWVCLKCVRPGIPSHDHK